MIWINKKMIKV